MAVTILLDFPIRPDAADVDGVLNTDLPATAAYPVTSTPKSCPTRPSPASCTFLPGGRAKRLMRHTPPGGSPPRARLVSRT